MLRSKSPSMIARCSGIWGVVAVALLLVSGCASPIRHQVTVFHDWPEQLAERTFKIVEPAADPADLKHRTYKRVIAAELEAAGFVESDRPVLSVEFEFGTKSREVSYHHRPYFTPYLSFGHHRRRGGIHFSAPLWGWYGWPHGYPSVATIHEHELKLTITDVRAGQSNRVFEGTSVTRSSGVTPVKALPLLTRSVLRDFPGESGVVRTIDYEAGATRQ